MCHCELSRKAACLTVDHKLIDSGNVAMRRCCRRVSFINGYPAYNWLLAIKDHIVPRGSDVLLVIMLNLRSDLYSLFYIFQLPVRWFIILLPQPMPDTLLKAPTQKCRGFAHSQPVEPFPRCNQLHLLKSWGLRQIRHGSLLWNRACLGGLICCQVLWFLFSHW